MKNKDESCIVKSGYYISTNFAFSIWYSKDTVKNVKKSEKNKYFCYTGEDCLDVSVEKMKEILNNFSHFLINEKIHTTDDLLYFYLWRIRLARKHNKLQKYYVTDCRAKAYAYKVKKSMIMK